MKPKGTQFGFQPGEQLPMFMTAKEIQERYQPAEGDWEFYTDDPQSWDAFQSTNPNDERYLTDRPMRTNGQWNVTASDIHGNQLLNDDGGKRYYRSPDPISEEEVWEQKADEAAAGYTNHVYTGETTYDSVQREGVKHPVWLGTGGDVGRTGKPQILGGHHRIASAMDAPGDQFIPVLHTDATSVRQLRGQSEFIGGKPLGPPPESAPWGGYR